MSSTTSGSLCVGAEGDDALGCATIPLTYSPEITNVENLVLEGQPQPGAAGYCFPDSEISFTVEFRGAF